MPMKEATAFFVASFTANKQVFLSFETFVKLRRGGLHPYGWTERLRRVWRGSSVFC